MNETIADHVATELMKANADHNYAPPMYHGTNRNALSMTAEERSDLSKACEIMQTYLLKVSDDNGCDVTHIGSSEAFGEENGRIIDGWQTAYFRRDGSALYSYGTVFFSNSPRKALRYAGRAIVLGETGYQTYWLNEGIKRMGYYLPPKTKAEEQAFELFEYHAAQKDEPVILMHCGLSMDLLRYENGSKIESILPSEIEVSYRYMGEIDLNDGVRISPSDVQAIYEA